MKELKAHELTINCNTSEFDFETTDDIENTTTILGQDRLSTAVEFGIGMRRSGFNIFALGPKEANKQDHIRQFIREKARNMDVPPDVCYVNNFSEVSSPRILTLPPGRGCTLRDDMNDLIEELIPTLVSAFETDEYQNRKHALKEKIQQEQDTTIEIIKQQAREKNFTLVKTEAGFSIAPTREGELMKDEDLRALPEEEREKIKEQIRDLQQELQKVIRQIPSNKRKIRKQVKELDKEIAAYAIRELLKEVREDFSDLEKVQSFLDEAEKDIVEHVQSILTSQEGSQAAIPGMSKGPSADKPASGKSALPSDGNPVLDRYKVNLLVDHCESDGAPVIYENNPSYKNLIGRVEHQSRMGTLITSFNLIKPGALHRANGGFLILDARRLLLEPHAWEGLKRVLKAGQLRIESPGEAYSVISTVSLEPEPLDLNVKVILLGERVLYYTLYKLDPDVQSLFKVEADFEDEIDRNEDNHQLYVELLGGLIRHMDLRPFDRGAVVRIIQESARMVGDAGKLTTRTQEINDLLLESDFWAGKQKQDIVRQEDVQKAIDQQIYRSGRIRDKVQESINRETVFIDTTGSRIGQINGLSVTRIGNLMFGRPNRITARVQLGKGHIINIEREVKLSGPMHSKGVLILKGFLGERYAQDRPLSLSASLVFEQSYTNIDGDSASSAELYALLSAIGEIPLKQSLSVTGSVNQHGQVQAIGGVNDKIEGFFDICSHRGLTGDQGVLIPQANEKNLVLRSDVLEAAEAGKFHIYSVETIDEGMELLTGLKMGEPDQEGRYPEGTIHARIISRLEDFAEKRKLFGSGRNGMEEPSRESRH